MQCQALLTVMAVLVPLHNRHGRREPVWLYYGRRNGSRKDTAMYCTPVDTRQTVSSRRQAHHREVHHRMPR